jgi:hypothetical protein
MSIERRQRTAADAAAGGGFRGESAPASDSRVRANPTKLPSQSAQVTPKIVTERRDGSADRSVVCLDRATASRPELAARPTLNAMTSTIDGQRTLALQGFELLGSPSNAPVAGVAGFVSRGHLTGK